MRCLAVVASVIALAGCEPKTSNESSGDDGKGRTAAASVPVKEQGLALDTPMKRDLDRICNAEEQSGALHEDPDARAQHVAVWLATNLESQEARTLSAELVSLAPPERKARLRDVLTENAMTDCEIIATW